MILIGSAAIKEHFNDFPRELKDIDFIRQYQEFIPLETLETTFDMKVEIHENEILSDLDEEILNTTALTTLKASHLCWNINWEKHMFDLQFLLKKGCKIDNELFWKLYSYWNKIHGKNKRSDLKMSKEEFFTNAVNYDTISHDETHKIINSIPIYTKCFKDGCDVELDENKYNLLTHEEKILFVKEEVMVMAYERYKSLGFKRAYNKMLKKFIISHIPLFALIYTLENYIEIEKNNINFIELIENYERH